jgi:hypothetical protein
MDFDKGEARSSTEESSVPSVLTPPTSPPRGPVGMSLGNASKDSLLSRGFGMSHGNHSKDSILERASSPINVNLARSTSPTYHSPFSGSPSLNRPSSRSGSPFTRGESPLQRGLVRMGSSNDIQSANSSPASNRSPRITRENVQKILKKKHSIESPLREKAENAFGTPLSGPSSLDVTPIDTAVSTPTRPPISRIPVPKLTRDNPTYDGVMSISPEPQPSDPPRPTMAPRSASFDVAAEATGADEVGFVQLGDMKSALDRLMADVAGEARASPDGQGVLGLKIEAVTEGIKAGCYSLPDTLDVEMPEAGPSKHDGIEDPEDGGEESVQMHIELPSMGPETLLSTSFLSPGGSNHVARPTSPRPPIVKDAIKTREELIKAKKREARRRDEDMNVDEDEVPAGKDYFTPRRPAPIRRRSLSTGDAEDLGRAAVRRRANFSDGGLLDVVTIEDGEDYPLADSIDRELNKLDGPSRTVSLAISFGRQFSLTGLYRNIT